jgi:hypothetical protein
MRALPPRRAITASRICVYFIANALYDMRTLSLVAPPARCLPPQRRFSSRASRHYRSAVMERQLTEKGIIGIVVITPSALACIKSKIRASRCSTSSARRRHYFLLFIGLWTCWTCTGKS